MDARSMYTALGDTHNQGGGLGTALDVGVPMDTYMYSNSYTSAHY